MGLLRRRDVSDLIRATLLWLLLAFSLGWYYTYTWYGRVGWPMPVPEPGSALLMYYFSVLNVQTEIQALHWLIVFPLSGLLWVAVLAVTAPFYGGRRTEYPYAALRFSMTALPLALPGPLLALMAARTPSGLSFARMWAVALRRGAVEPGTWVTPLYVGLGVVCLIWQIVLYVRVFDIHGKKAWLHYLVSLILLALMSVGLGVLTALPLRYWLE